MLQAVETMKTRLIARCSDLIDFSIDHEMIEELLEAHETDPCHASSGALNERFADCSKKDVMEQIRDTENPLLDWHVHFCIGLSMTFFERRVSAPELTLPWRLDSDRMLQYVTQS